MSSLISFWEPRVLSILRIITGVLYMQHGLNKFFGFPPNGRPHAAYHLFTLVPGLAGILELFGGILIVLGLFTRPVAFILSGEMAFAYFLVHVHHGAYPLVNGGGSPVLLYLFVSVRCRRRGVEPRPAAGAGSGSLVERRPPRLTALAYGVKCSGRLRRVIS